MKEYTVTIHVDHNIPQKERFTQEELMVLHLESVKFLEHLETLGFNINPGIYTQYTQGY